MQNQHLLALTSLIWTSSLVVMIRLRDKRLNTIQQALTCTEYQAQNMLTQINSLKEAATLAKSK